MADNADIAAATEPQSRFKTVTLAYPIVRGETRIETLNIRKPKAGELRNLSLQDVLSTDITALLTLIPRVTDPPLHEDEVDNLETEDLSEIGGIVRGFFMTKAELAAVEALMAQHRPKTSSRKSRRSSIGR
ncbi:phage tail assembly protein [Novosphingobium guangzhouense]|uniref:Phage tail protein n=1 Tax=Novosphingobium guangzhouense TaxID=1850347 RepID=A0A2K2G609_9SPHN|nr:phage tail assembly protein [Novosphingobium guangzhouense]PNU06464.1 hypothetical protein A8V01_02665 [Novosphingobium guangzhouense]